MDKLAINRRLFLLGAPLALAGCAQSGAYRPLGVGAPADPYYAAIYGPMDDGHIRIPAVDLSEIPPRFWRREVADPTGERPGTIVVDPANRFAYFVLPNHRAIRYGVGVGREEAFNFRGEATIARKAEWPHWTPTEDMIHRQPKLYGPVRAGLPGGINNPLGARALYLYRNGVDSHYRLHGTNEPSTIGTMVSSGCIRFLNQDIIDLYNRAPVGTRVNVLPAERPLTARDQTAGADREYDAADDPTFGAPTDPAYAMGPDAAYGAPDYPDVGPGYPAQIDRGY